MNLLGDVNNGWFAQLAGGVESAGRWVGNVVTGGSGGDAFYDNMGRQAETVVTGINQRTIDNAIANGATQQQALQQGSAAMDRLANPQNASDLLDLGGAGAQTAGNTVLDTIMPSFDLGGILMGALAVGGTLVACEMCSGPSSTPTVRRDRRDRAYA